CMHRSHLPEQAWPIGWPALKFPYGSFRLHASVHLVLGGVHPVQLVEMPLAVDVLLPHYLIDPAELLDDPWIHPAVAGQGQHLGSPAILVTFDPLESSPALQRIIATQPVPFAVVSLIEHGELRRPPPDLLPHL